MKKVLTIIGYILYAAIIFAYPVYDIYIGYNGFEMFLIVKFVFNIFFSYLIVSFVLFLFVGVYQAFKGDIDARHGCLYPLLAMILLIAVTLFFSYNRGKQKKIEKFTGESVRKERVVYICTGPSAKKYHRIRTCRWLDNCSGEIEELTIEKAEARGKGPCKGCY